VSSLFLGEARICGDEAETLTRGEALTAGKAVGTDCIRGDCGLILKKKKS
jgi:hypothetical protein